MVPLRSDWLFPIGKREKTPQKGAGGVSGAAAPPEFEAASVASPDLFHTYRTGYPYWYQYSVDTGNPSSERGLYGYRYLVRSRVGLNGP